MQFYTTAILELGILLTLCGPRKNMRKSWTIFPLAAVHATQQALRLAFHDTQRESITLYYKRAMNLNTSVVSNCSWKADTTRDTYRRVLELQTRLFMKV